MLKKSIVVLGIIVVFIAAAVLITSNGDTKQTSQKTTDSSTSANQAKSENTVDISNFAYKPENLKIKKGTTVTWVNNDPTNHNVVFDDTSVGKVEDSKLVNKGEKLKHTFDTVGKYSYFCQVHPYMTAAIEVTE